MPVLCKTEVDEDLISRMRTTVENGISLDEVIDHFCAGDSPVEREVLMLAYRAAEMLTADYDKFSETFREDENKDAW